MNQNQINFKYNEIIAKYLVYELDNWPVNAINNFTIKNFLSSVLKLKINAIKRKCVCNGSGVASDGSWSWNFGYEFAPNVAIFSCWL